MCIGKYIKDMKDGSGTDIGTAEDDWSRTLLAGLIIFLLCSIPTIRHRWQTSVASDNTVRMPGPDAAAIAILLILTSKVYATRISTLEDISDFRNYSLWDSSTKTTSLLQTPSTPRTVALDDQPAEGELGAGDLQADSVEEVSCREKCMALCKGILKIGSTINMLVQLLITPFTACAILAAYTDCFAGLGFGQAPRVVQLASGNWIITRNASMTGDSQCTEFASVNEAQDVMLQTSQPQVILLMLAALTISFGEVMTMERGQNERQDQSQDRAPRFWRDLLQAEEEHKHVGDRFIMINYIIKLNNAFGWNMLNYVEQVQSIFLTVLQKVKQGMNMLGTVVTNTDLAEEVGNNVSNDVQTALDNASNVETMYLAADSWGFGCDGPVVQNALALRSSTEQAAEIVETAWKEIKAPLHNLNQNVISQLSVQAAVIGLKLLSDTWSFMLSSFGLQLLESFGAHSFDPCMSIRQEAFHAPFGISLGTGISYIEHVRLILLCWSVVSALVFSCYIFLEVRLVKDNVLHLDMMRAIKNTILYCFPFLFLLFHLSFSCKDIWPKSRADSGRRLLEVASFSKLIQNPMFVFQVTKLVQVVSQTVNLVSAGLAVATGDAGWILVPPSQAECYTYLELARKDASLPLQVAEIHPEAKSALQNHFKQEVEFNMFWTLQAAVDTSLSKSPEADDAAAMVHKRITAATRQALEQGGNAAAAAREMAARAAAKAARQAGDGMHQAMQRAVAAAKPSVPLTGNGGKAAADAARTAAKAAMDAAQAAGASNLDVARRMVAAAAAQEAAEAAKQAKKTADEIQQVAGDAAMKAALEAGADAKAAYKIGAAAAGKAAADAARAGHASLGFWKAFGSAAKRFGDSSLSAKVRAENALAVVAEAAADMAEDAHKSPDTILQALEETRTTVLEDDAGVTEKMVRKYVATAAATSLANLKKEQAAQQPMEQVGCRCCWCCCWSLGGGDQLSNKDETMSKGAPPDPDEVALAAGKEAMKVIEMAGGDREEALEVGASVAGVMRADEAKAALEEKDHERLETGEFTSRTRADSRRRVRMDMKSIAEQAGRIAELFTKQMGCPEQEQEQEQHRLRVEEEVREQQEEEYKEGGYAGELKDGKKHGEGLWELPDGELYSGQFKDDKRHGQGTMEYSNGDSIFGEWKEGQPHGRCEMRYVNRGRCTGIWQDGEPPKEVTMNFDDGSEYFGSWKDGKRHGVNGTHKGVDGSVYVGSWKDDQKHGAGEYVWADKSKYSGQWQGGKRHGKNGKYTGADKSVYEGPWQDDKRHGEEGKYTWANGSEYFGQWKDGKRHGHGKYTDADKSMYEGEWQDDQRHGKGTYTWADGKTYSGLWQAGLKHGDRGTLTLPNGDKYEGPCKDGKLHGDGGTYTWADGRMYTGSWKDNKPHGQGEMRYAQSKSLLDLGEYEMYEGQWKEGKRDGHGVMTYTEVDGGQRGSASVYAMGRKFVSGARGSGYKTWYIGQWKDDWRHGEGLLELEDGEKRQGNWLRGELDGQLKDCDRETDYSALVARLEQLGH
eukprot:TRINITY_DN4155_c0_g1_i10.p1 TRINITY_DN4155_c0_g1~~TRINITY_DN4155_c0_g1_i10.p1  ORF type:complete len:1620 (+),score=354.63 TRINITY_DN4155_c0_g1_i10:281-4861(+)